MANDDRDARTADPAAARSLLAHPLDIDERTRLEALRAATSEQTPLYAAILTVLADAKAAYHLQLRTPEIVERLTMSTAPSASMSGTAVFDPGDQSPERALRAALDQLRDWRCIDWVQDPTFRAASVDEYLKRNELWELTPIGDATLQAMQLVLGATEERGALQRAMLRRIRDALVELTVAIDTADATGVYLRLRDLDLALGELAANAREFYATINRIAREDRLDDHVFLVYKDQLIAYLQDFHDDLVRHRAAVSRQLIEIDDRSRTTLLVLAADGDDSGGLLGTSDSWEARWDGMLDWFVAGRVERSEIDALIGATTLAIRELLTLLRRLTEQATRPLNRAAELQAVAAWFARCESIDDAHELFDAAFGLSPTLHLGIPTRDPDLGGRFPSWWEAEPVEVPVSLREYGRRPAPGRTARRHDYTAAKEQLEAERAAEDEARHLAAKRLVTIDLATTAVDPGAWPLLLSFLDQALAARQNTDTFDTTVHLPDATVHLRSAEHDTRIGAPGGWLRLRRCELIVAPSSTPERMRA